MKTKKMKRKHDTVVLISDMPAAELEKDTIGTIVHLYPDLEHCEVEFVTTQGTKVVTLSLDQIKILGTIT